MSAEATFWAWNQDVKSTLKLTLLALANCHNENTDRCDPSIIYISKTTGLDKKTVQKNLVDLENSGLIIRSSRTGTSTSYTLNIEHKPYPKTGIPKNGSSQKRVIPKTDLTLPKNGMGVYPKTGTKPKKKLKETKKILSRTEAWKEFFKLYPANKKGGRDETAFKKAKSLKLGEEDFHRMLTDIKTRRAVCPKWYGRYAPGICNYLTDRYWEAEITAEVEHETSKSLSAIDRVKKATGQTGSAEDEPASDGQVVASYG